MEKKKNDFVLTDGAMCLIEDIVQRKHLTDRLQILEAVCEALEERYNGDAMEFHLEHMHLSTTSEILRAIDVYFVMREEFPDYSFRHPANQKKAS